MTTIFRSEVATDRAMDPDAVLAEIIGPAAGKTRGWVIRVIPRECRWNARTRPPLYSEKRTRAWWEKAA